MKGGTPFPVTLTVSATVTLTVSATVTVNITLTCNIPCNIFCKGSKEQHGAECGGMGQYRAHSHCMQQAQNSLHGHSSLRKTVHRQFFPATHRPSHCIQTPLKLTHWSIF